MDWARKNPHMGVQDLATFGYGAGKQCQVVRIPQRDARKGVISKKVLTEDEWKDIFHDERTAKALDASYGGVVILAARAEERPPNGEDIHDPSILSQLPLSQATWSHVLEIFHVHGSVAKLINRGLSYVFSRDQISMDGGSSPSVVYNCRSPASWPGDMAMSMTWFPDRNFWYAIFYGCTEGTMKDIEGRLRNSEDAVCHPLLLPGIFAELERQRQIRMVKNGSAKLVETVANLQAQSKDKTSFIKQHSKDHGTGNDGYSEISQAIEPWLNIFHLKNGLENWKEQLEKMVAHADELNASRFEHDNNHDTEVNNFRSLMRTTGDRIKERLQDMIRDYQEQIRACNRNLEGMTLANQMAHTEANMEIASRTKADSTQMKSIALLTMIFLPATFLATVFSMSFFNWQPDSGQNEVEVSPRIWIYVVMALALTLITVTAWFWFLKRRPRAAPEEQLEEYEL